MTRTIASRLNMNIDSELLLTAIRRVLLLQKNEPLERPDMLQLIEGLMRQCMINEYVWFAGEDERAEVTRRTTSLADAEPGQVDWQDLALICLYHRPQDLLSQRVARKALNTVIESMPANLAQFIRAVLADHAAELALKSGIERLGTITNETSKLIADNYEHYPYPRWTTLERPNPPSRQQHLRRFFAEGELDFLDEPFDVLVAGCGTGNKAIEYAKAYGNSTQVLGVDLSLASLSYASRKARELGLSNIRFAQGDLLELPPLEKKFRIIECTGVLHHMRDPLEGLRALVKTLQPPGVVHISLYSELARASIVRLREEYDLRPDMTDDEIRAYRRRIMLEQPETVDERLSLRWDFFDLPRCKDLLFHPLEHRYTVPKIGRLLADAGLEFRAIESPGIIRNQYWTTLPEAREQADLNAWDRFEKRHPDAFGNLYEIWAFRPQV